MRYVLELSRFVGRHMMWASVMPGILLGMLLVAPIAQADDAGLYLGAQLYSIRHSSPGGTDVSGSLTLGYRLNDYWGVEASAKKTHPDDAFSASHDNGVHGGELALRFRHDLSDWFGVTAKVGAYHWRDTGASELGAKRGTDAVVGTGLTFRVSERISLSTEYEKILGFAANREDNYSSVGLRYDFN